MKRDPESCPWFFVPLAIILILTAYGVVFHIDQWSDAALRGLPADYAQR